MMTTTLEGVKSSIISLMDKTINDEEENDEDIDNNDNEGQEQSTDQEVEHDDQKEEEEQDNNKQETENENDNKENDNDVQNMLTKPGPRYRGSCHCGAVQFECGEPIRAPVCHCAGCQSLHGAPYVWSLVLKKNEFVFLNDSEKNLNKYNDLYCTCKYCHGKVVDMGKKYYYTFIGILRNNFLLNPKTGRRRIPKKFQPSHHCFYNQRSVDVYDDKPKFVGKYGSQRCDCDCDDDDDDDEFESGSSSDDDDESGSDNDNENRQ